MAPPDQRDHRHAHRKRLERAVDVAERHRIEHDVDEPVARLVLRVVAALRQEQVAVARDARRRHQLLVRAAVLRTGGREREAGARNAFGDFLPEREAASRQLHRRDERADHERVRRHRRPPRDERGDLRRLERRGTDRRSRSSRAAARSGAPGPPAGPPRRRSACSRSRQAQRPRARDVRDLDARRLERQDARPRTLRVRLQVDEQVEIVAVDHARRLAVDRPRRRRGTRSRPPRIAGSSDRARPTSNRSRPRSARGRGDAAPPTSSCPSRGRAGLPTGSRS